MFGLVDSLLLMFCFHGVGLFEVGSVLLLSVEVESDLVQVVEFHFLVWE